VTGDNEKKIMLAQCKHLSALSF